MDVLESEGGRPRDDSQKGGQGDSGHLLLWRKVAPNIKGKESSVHVSSIWELEFQHPTIRIL